MPSIVVPWLMSLFISPRQSPFPKGTGPARLIVLRHAEKTGKKSDTGLSPAGTARAARLATYIPEAFGPPAFLIAARTSKRSRRPVETLEPLAAATGLSIRDDLDDSEVKKLVKALRDDPTYRGKAGVISWRHSDLPDLATALGALERLMPDWHEDDYTTVIVLDYGSDTPRAQRVAMPF